MKLWMFVDEYSFPIATANTAGELARMLGASEYTIRSIACRVNKGEYKNGKYVCVECGDDETEEEVENEIRKNFKGKMPCADLVGKNHTRRDHGGL